MTSYRRHASYPCLYPFFIYQMTWWKIHQDYAKISLKPVFWCYLPRSPNIKTWFVLSLTFIKTESTISQSTGLGEECLKNFSLKNFSILFEIVNTVKLEHSSFNEQNFWSKIVANFSFLWSNTTQVRFLLNKVQRMAKLAHDRKVGSSNLIRYEISK